MKNILVTGANGQLGSELKELSHNQDKYTFLFHDIDTLDITNKPALTAFGKNHKFDCIVNCAAYTAVDKAEEEKEQAQLINAQAVKNLVELAESKNAYFIHISTDYVFDGTKHKPYTESDKTNPTSVYGTTKLEGEMHADEYAKAITIRTSWLYSQFGNNFVKTMLRLGKEKDKLNVVFDQIGSPTNAADLAQCVLSMIEISSEKGTLPSGTYHYSNEGVCSWYDFAKEIMDARQLNCKLLPIESHEYPVPAPRPHYSVLNKAKIKRTFNIAIPHWKDSLMECLTKIAD